MNLKKTLFFALILGALFFYIKEYEIPAQDAELKKDKVFKNLSAEEISSVTVVHGAETFTFVNSNPHAPKPQDIEAKVEDSSDELTGKKDEPLTWKLQDTPNAMLDPGRVTSLVSSIGSLTSEQTIAAPDVESDKKTYGLDAPEVVLTVSGKGQTKTLRFGKTNEFLGKRYLAVDGDSSLYLVNDSLFTAANKTKKEFRDKTPVTFTDDSVQTLSISNPENSIELQRAEEPQWKMVQPHPGTGSAFAVYDVFRNLRNLTVDDFIDTPSPDLSTYGLTSPILTVMIKGKDTEIKTVFGTKDSKTYFQINGTGPVYETKSEIKESFLTDPNAFREKQLFRFDNYFAQKVTIEPKGGKKLELVKDKDTWKLNGKDADAPFVRQYLKTLSDTRVADFPASSEGLGFETPELKVTVTITENDKTTNEALIIGSKHGDTYAAMVDGSNEPFYISLDTFKDIHTSEELLLPHTGNDS